MKKLLTFILFWSMLLTATAQPQTDPRSIQVAGIPIEGPLDSVRVSLKAGDFTEWGLFPWQLLRYTGQTHAEHRH